MAFIKVNVTAKDSGVYLSLNSDPNAASGESDESRKPPPKPKAKRAKIYLGIIFQN